MSMGMEEAIQLDRVSHELRHLKKSLAEERFCQNEADPSAYSFLYCDGCGEYGFRKDFEDRCHFAMQKSLHRFDMCPTTETGGYLGCACAPIEMCDACADDALESGVYELIGD